MIYIELFLVAVVTIYIVDLSGFTDSWRSALARMLNVSSLRRIKPFDCGQCMTWWVCLTYCLCVQEWGIFQVAWCAVLSMMSVPIGQALICAREWINWMIRKLMEKL